MKRIVAILLAAMLVMGCISGCGEKKTAPAEGGMKIATTTADFDAYASTHEERIELLHEAGFRYVDMSFYGAADMEPFMEDGWEAYAETLHKLMKKKGMTFVQAHSIGGNAFKDEATYNNIVENTIRSIYVCKALNIPQIVVHAPYRSHMTKDEFFTEVLAFYQEFFPAMEETGVKVLIENSAEGIVGCDYYFYTGADMREFIEYANHPLLGACWDTGHGNVQGHQYYDLIDLGDLLWSVHINDNQGLADEHLMPYQGTMSVDEVMSALVKIGYDGAFTFEATKNLNPGSSWPYSRVTYTDSLKGYVPPLEIKMDMEKTLYDIGVYLLTLYEIPVG